MSCHAVTPVRGDEARAGGVVHLYQPKYDGRRMASPVRSVSVCHARVRAQRACHLESEPSEIERRYVAMGWSNGSIGISNSTELRVGSEGKQPIASINSLTRDPRCEGGVWAEEDLGE